MQETADPVDRPNTKHASVSVKRESKSADTGKAVKRSDSLTKDEKTESNTKAREREMRQTSVGQKTPRKFVQRSGESGLKRRHTVGGTRDFDKVIQIGTHFCFILRRVDTIRLKGANPLVG